MATSSGAWRCFSNPAIRAAGPMTAEEFERVLRRYPGDV
jgi:hypothetical protein